jgi:stage II sporulation protein R
MSILIIQKIFCNSGGIFMGKVLLMIKQFGSNQRSSTIVKITAVMAATVLVAMIILSISYSEDVNKGLADNLIRLHVIANSDSVEDQAIKNRVRDAILNYMKEQLRKSKDLEETNYIINKNISEIEELSNAEILKQGKDYSVKAMLGSYPFPTKSYGDVTLPAGYYQALRVVIGKGEGNNWWCVLFPPLCFVDATHGTVPDDVKKDLQKSLTAEEYRIIMSADSNDDMPIRIRFKVVELFQNSRIKFAGMISKLFKSGD